MFVEKIVTVQDMPSLYFVLLHIVSAVEECDATGVPYSY